MVMFGHIDCDKCQMRHPDSDDCQGEKLRRIELAQGRKVIYVTAPRACVSFLTGLDDGPWLKGHGARARKRIVKSPEEMTAIRAKAWATRREKLGPRGHR